MTSKERRKRQRLRLRLPVLLLRADSGMPLRTETTDVSNNGFYCNTTQPFAPGESLTCLIGLPDRASGSGAEAERVYLEARVDVVRIVVNNGKGFGVGCRISHYHVIANDSIPAWALAAAEETVAEPAVGQPA